MIETLVTIVGISGVIYFLHRIQREIGGLSVKVDHVLKTHDFHGESLADHEKRIARLEDHDGSKR